MEWSTADVEWVLGQLGFNLARRESHDTYVKQGHMRTVSVPRNRSAITKGTLGSIWRQAGISGQQARELREKKR